MQRNADSFKIQNIWQNSQFFDDDRGVFAKK